MTENSPDKEKRKWSRLRLAIPVFVRSHDESGKDSLEFATAVNISPGGALVVVKRSIALAAPVSLEIPSISLGPITGVPHASRAMKAKTVWVSHLDGCHLLGLKFTRPLDTNGASPRKGRGKAPAAM